ncbi:hypothetical protein MRX96_011639 [Rhipicephalus microplus]
MTRAFDEKRTSVAYNGSRLNWWGPASKSSAKPIILIPTVTGLELAYAGFKDAVAGDYRGLVDLRIPPSGGVQ